MRNSKLIVITRRLLTPDKIPGINIAAWFSTMESGSVILDGTTASQWSDISGNNRHATQATKAKQPTYTPDGLNGKPVLTFDGVDDEIRTGNIFSGATDFSVASVFRRSGTSGTMLAMGLNDGNNYTYDLSTRVDFANSVRIIHRQPGDARSSPANSVVGDAFVTVSTRGSSVILDTFNGVNAVVQSPPAVPSQPTFAQSALAIGAGGSSGFFNGLVSEIVITGSVLSTTDRQQLEGYLAWRRGLQANLANNHPFKFSPPYI
jgi:hypothetical protein